MFELVRQMVDKNLPLAIAVQVLLFSMHVSRAAVTHLIMPGAITCPVLYALRIPGMLLTCVK